MPGLKCPGADSSTCGLSPAPVDTHRDELVDRHVPVPRLDVPDELDRDAMDAHRDELVGRDAFVAEVPESADVFRRDAVDPEGDETVDRHVLISQFRHGSNEL